MKLYLGPYEKYDPWMVHYGYITFGRRGLNAGGIYLVWQGHNGRWTHVDFVGRNRGRDFSSLEEAQQSLDTELKKQGYILLTNEQYERLSVLL